MTITRAQKYFAKNGFIFGDSYKYEFGWKHWITKFTDWDEAIEWFNTEQYDFRTREFISKTEAQKLGYREDFR